MKGLKIVNINPIKMKSLGGLMKTEQDIINLIANDSYMMDILDTAEQLNLDDYWVCAGFIRNKVWDTIHKYSMRTPYNDVDVIYFDQTDLNVQNEKLLEEKLLKIDPEIPWEVVNQARIYNRHPDVSAFSASDGIAHFPETPTSVGIRVKEGKLVLTAPHGIEDLINGIVNPTPLFTKDKYNDTYQNRINSKSWTKTWPDLVINTD